MKLQRPLGCSCGIRIQNEMEQCRLLCSYHGSEQKKKGHDNTMGLTPLGVTDADSRIFFDIDYTDDEYWQEMLTRKVTFTVLVIYSVVFALGFVGNGMVIFMLVFCMKKTANTIWLLNLTIANFLLTCSLPLRITHSALKLHWPFGNAMCKLNDSIAYLSLYASAYFLAVISIDRCVSLRSSVQAQNPQRNRLGCFMALGIWLLALLLSSLRIHFRRTEQSPIDEEVIICFLHYGTSFIQAKINRYIIVTCQYVFAIIVPLSMTIACQVKMAQGQRHGAQWLTSFKVITTVTAIFYLFWLPYHVFSFFDAHYLMSSSVLIVGIPLATALAFASSCVNPIVYIVMGYNFKERPRPPFLSAFQNAFGEESSHRVPETEAKPTTEMTSQNL